MSGALSSRTLCSTSSCTRRRCRGCGYDENGRRWKTSAPNPKTGSATEGTLDTLYHFDALGQVITIVKPGGGEVHRVFNANGTLHRVHGHHTVDVEFRYSGRAERTGMITWYGPDDTPAHTRWYFNVRGQLAFKEDASGKRVRYTYTPGGKLETRTWARGIVATHHYDPENHVDLRTIDYSDQTPDVHFTHTRLGQRKAVKDAGGLLTYGYDPEAPYVLLSETRHGSPYGEAKTITYTRDEFNRSTGFQIGTAADPAQDYAVRYGYDLVSRLDLIAAQGYEFRYGYLPHSTSDLVKTLRALFVKETEFAYEPGRDAIASVTNRVGFNHEQMLSQYGYAINADGQRTTRTTTHGGVTFTDSFGYDPDTGGLTSSKRVDSVDAYNHTFAFDKIGNREVAVSGAKTPVTYRPNALNQYVGIEGDTSIVPTHDADGNLTRRGDRTFTWDANNRLIAIHERGILIARYTYDHKSRRIARWTHDGVDERYLYQGWNLIAVYRPGETEPVETYTWGKDLSGSLQGAGGVGGLLFAKKRGHGQDAWIYHFDANGNVTEVTDSQGNLLDHYEYDPFGNLAKPPLLPENRFRFSTKLQDAETGFCYYGYRYYDPKHGRWLSRDPIEEEGGLNLYGFLGNDPVNGWDYLGLDELDLKYDALVRQNFREWVAFLDAPGKRVNTMREMLDDIDEEVSKNCDNCVKTLLIVAHGSAGQVNIAGTVFDAHDLGFQLRLEAHGAPQEQISKLLLMRELAGYMCDNATITWNACNFGSEGNDVRLRSAFNDIFGPGVTHIIPTYPLTEHGDPIDPSKKKEDK